MCRIKLLIKKHPIWFILLFIFIFILISVLIINPFLYNLINESNEKNSVSEINSFLYFLTGGATFALAIIAWHKLSGIKEQSVAQFLLQIDERWSSKEILDARKTLHGIYRKISKMVGNSQDLNSKIGNEIIRMSESDDKEEQNRFIELLNFLELMESVGYLRYKRYVKAEDLDSLFGESLEFNFKIFEPYIEHKRKKHGKNEFFRKFESLYIELRKLDLRSEKNGDGCKE